MSARSQVDKVCRLEDAQGYEFVPMWKSEKGTEDCAAEMQPFTSLPVYQPTQTPSAASTMRAPSQGDKVCRLEDAQGYEFAPVWKPEKGTEDAALCFAPWLFDYESRAAWRRLEKSQDQLRTYVDGE